MRPTLSCSALDCFGGDRFIAAVQHKSGCWLRQEGAEAWALHLPNGLHVEEPVKRIDFDATHHAGEHVEAFAFVFDQRIFLAIPAQADAVAQLIHAEQMILPMMIDDLQQHHFFQDTASGPSPVPFPCVRRPRHWASSSSAQRVPSELLQVIRAPCPRWPCVDFQPELGMDRLGRDRPYPIPRDTVLRGNRRRASDSTRLPVIMSWTSPHRFSPRQDGAAVLVDHFALLVHDVVVLEELFANFEIVRFDLLLRVRDRARDHAMLDRHAFFHAKFEHQIGHALGSEDAHQIVFKREIEPGRARIALPAGAATQLVVDAAAFVALRSENMQSAEADAPLACSSRTPP